MAIQHNLDDLQWLWLQNSTSVPPIPSMRLQCPRNGIFPSWDGSPDDWMCVCLAFFFCPWQTKVYAFQRVVSDLPLLWITLICSVLVGSWSSELGYGYNLVQYYCTRISSKIRYCHLAAVGNLFLLPTELWVVCQYLWWGMWLCAQPRWDDFLSLNIVAEHNAYLNHEAKLLSTANRMMSSEVEFQVGAILFGFWYLLLWQTI